MKKFYLIATLMLTFFSTAYANEPEETLTVNYAYASSDSEQGVSQKKGSSSVTNQGVEITSVEQLNVFPLFGDKYKRHPGCVLTVIENQHSKFRELKVNDNPELVKEIHALVEKDAVHSSNVIRKYNKDSDETVISGEYGTIGYTEYIDKGSCTLFMSGR